MELYMQRLPHFFKTEELVLQLNISETLALNLAENLLNNWSINELHLDFD